MSQPAPRTPIDPRKRRVFFLVMLSLPILALATLYVGSIVARGGWSYYKFKIRQHSWSGQAWQADPTLGYAHVPGFRGRQSVSPESDQALHLDGGGFRIPAGGRPPGRGGPRVLSLGGSFTFGVGVESQETYTDLVAARLGGAAFNAGTNGYGLTQMILQSGTLTEQVEADVLLAAYAPWLVMRAAQRYSSTRFAAVPVPYVTGEGPPIEIAPPAFRPKVFDLDLSERLARPAGPVGLSAYLWQVAFPLYLHDDAHRLAVRIAARTGREPEPLDDPAAIVRAGYGAILAHARAAGARLYVVDVTSFSLERKAETAALRAIPGLRFVETRDVLWGHVGSDVYEDYLRVFAHWGGDPPVMVDLHPNAKAHRILAEEAWKAIEADATASEADAAASEADATAP